MVAVPVTMVADGLAARIQDGGGDRVLWLHGYTLDSSSWSGLWNRLPGYCHIGIDLPGHGASDPIGRQDTLHALGLKVAGLCRDRDIRHIVALSFGTLTAIQVLIEEPHFLHSIVLGAPSLAGGPQDPDVGGAYAKLCELYRRAGSGPEMTALWMRCRAWDGIEKQPRLREQLGALVTRHRWTELEDWGIRRLLQPPQSIEALRGVSTAVLILIGDEDLPASHACADLLMGAVTRCERVSLPATGHLCMLESPGLCEGPIRRHLQTHGRRPPSPEASGGLVPS